MNLTIKDVLQLFQDKDVVLAAGSDGMNNIVNSVNIMDAPDIWNWVKPGELILTTAYTVKDDPVLQEELIRNLAASGSSGIGIKTKRFLPEIPEIMKKVADEVRLPILELPLTLSLAEIMNPIISSIAARQSYLLQRSNEIHKALTKEAIESGGIHQIIACLGRLTQCPVGCYDTNGHPISHWLPSNIPGIDTDSLQQLGQLLNAKLDDTDELQKSLAQAKNPCTTSVMVDKTEFLLTSFAIMSSNEYFGHISLIQPAGALADINCIALEHGCTVAALNFLKQKAVSESRRLRSRDILEHVLFGNLENQGTKEVIQNSKVAQAKRFQCLVIAMQEDLPNINTPIILNRMYKTTLQLVSAEYPLSLISERAGQIIVLLAAAATLNPNALHGQLYHALTTLQKNVSVSIGVGTVVSELEAVRQSYDSASTCLTLGRQIKGEGHLTYLHEVTIYYLLSQLDDSNLLSQVCEPIIAKLTRYDNQHNADLIKTLENYLEYDKNVTNTAAALYIHRNTLSNRLEKIQDITGLDLNDHELLFSLRLALRRAKLLNKQPV